MNIIYIVLITITLLSYNKKLSCEEQAKKDADSINCSTSDKECRELKAETEIGSYITCTSKRK